MYNEKNLKGLKKKKIVFAYLNDSTFKQINDGDLEKIDVINYSFGRIVCGKVSIEHLKHLETVQKLANHFGVRMVLAIGGWGAGGFSEMARTKESRQVFIHSVLKIINEYNFHGVDLDWEYPTSKVADIEACLDDKSNFTFLVNELRAAFNELNPDLILSSAVGGGGHAVKYYEVEKIAQNLNYIHLMTYDLINYSSLETTHHTNLYQSKNSVTSADETVKAFLAAGAINHKLVLGIAFYGHIGTVNSLSEDGMKVFCEDFSKSITYTNISNRYLNNEEVKIFYDEIAKASWLFDGKSFITYDDPYSIAHKCEYVKRNSLAGVMFWELNHDLTGDLVKAIDENLNK